MCGPNVQIYTATHPINYRERSLGLEYAKPITIGEDVWVGGNAVICPGVTTSRRSIIGAISIVAKNIPPDILAAGNPYKVTCPLQGNDKPGNQARNSSAALPKL
jgi:maltose O-acetyltransferase